MSNAKTRPGAASRRVRREARTIELMIRMYCAAGHPSGAGGNPAARAQRSRRGASRSPLCPDCAALLDYSFARIDECRLGAAKPICSRCTVHCYRPAMRERVRAAMRWSGPRMTHRHPYLAMRHLLDRRKHVVR
jgi:Nitrous oxide-stimulated promoter